MTNNKPARSIEDRIAAMHADLEQSESFAIELVKDRLTEVIHGLMEQKNFSRADLAQAIGVSRPYITKLLRGDVNFTIGTLVKIARALNVELAVEALFVQPKPAQTKRVRQSTHRPQRSSTAISAR